MDGVGWDVFLSGVPCLSFILVFGFGCGPVNGCVVFECFKAVISALRLSKLFFLDFDPRVGEAEADSKLRGDFFVRGDGVGIS